MLSARSPRPRGGSCSGNHTIKPPGRSMRPGPTRERSENDLKTKEGRSLDQSGRPTIASFLDDAIV
jgi:hypothetical protein